MDMVEIEQEYFKNAIKWYADEAEAGTGGQTTLAHIYGCTNQYINQIVSGKKKPSYKVQVKFAEKLQTTREKLLEIGANRLKGILPSKEMTGQAHHTPPQPCQEYANIQDEFMSKHFEVVKEFQDREWALKANQTLVMLERIAPEQKEMALRLLNTLIPENPHTLNEKKTG